MAIKSRPRSMRKVAGGEGTAQVISPESHHPVPLEEGNPAKRWHSQVSSSRLLLSVDRISCWVF